MIILNFLFSIISFLSTDLRAVEAAAEAIGSLNPREFDIRFNPDAYVPEVVPSKCEVACFFFFLILSFCNTLAVLCFPQISENYLSATTFIRLN